ncbi:MAG: hypothetical protein WAO88_02930, partial [Roseicyclus sp.]|uniref:hypothetical protein n=1 Tax=Roseicyclus sp. TaxID=1914329 RepID=UPI003BAF0215
HNMDIITKAGAVGRWIIRSVDSQGIPFADLELMELNIHHPSLRLRQLSGRLSVLSSVSINMSYRITIELIILDADIILVDVGAHEDLYR